MPDQKAIYSRWKRGETIEDILSGIYRDIHHPDTPQAQLRRSARLPSRVAATDPTLLAESTKWREEKEKERDKELEDRLGITVDRGPYKSYLDRLLLRKGRTPETKEREKQKRDIRSGETTVPSHSDDLTDKLLGGAQSATRLIRDVATGDIIIDPALKAAGLDEESAEKAGRATKGGVGAGAGFVKGIQAAKILPAYLKPAAPLVGALAGRVMADLSSTDYEIDEETGLPLATKPTTPTEIIETGSAALGSQSVLNTLKGAPTVLRLVVGGAEAAGINEATLQSINAAEAGEPLPMGAKDVWDRNKLALGLGAFIGKFAGGKPKTPAPVTGDDVGEAINKINNKLKSDISKVRKEGIQKILNAAEGKGEDYKLLGDLTGEVKASSAQKIIKLEAAAAKKVEKAYSKLSPEYAFEEARNKALSALREKMTQAKFIGSHGSTRGRRNAAKRLAQQLKDDIGNIERNPQILVDNSKPRQMQRLLIVMRNKKSLEDALKGKQRVDERAILEDEILYLNSLETGDAETMARQLVRLGEGATPEATARQVANYRKSMKPDSIVTEGQNIERVGDGWIGTGIKKYTTDPLFKWANRQKEGSVVGKALGKVEAGLDSLNTPMLNRLYMGTADILERGAQRSGAGEKGALFQLAKGLRKSVDDGNFLAADYKFRLFNKADELGYGTYTNRAKTKSANKEFENFLRLRHSKAGGIRGEADEAGDFLAADNLRIARSKDYYNKMSPMGKALADGWAEASGRAGSKMLSLDVLVKMPNGKYRKAQKHINYFPRKLKPEFEELIEDNFKLYDRKGEGSTDVKKMLKVFGARNKSELEQKLGGYIKLRSDAVKVDGSPTSFYSHLEKARVLEDLPADAQDFSVDLAANYLDRSGRSLAQIEHFGGQATRLDGQPNENFIFNIIAKGKSDKNTKTYVDNIHKAIFTAKEDAILRGLNKVTTGAFIANPSSAIKNLTGAFKTWTITGTEPMAKSMVRAFGDTISDIASTMKGINKRRPNSELAKRIGATSDDIGKITSFIDNEALTAGSRSGGGALDKLVGGGLKVTGFTPAEDFVRKQGTIAADLARREWMDLVDSSPNAKQLIDAISKLHANPKSPVLQLRVKKLIEVSPDVNRKLSEAARFTAKQNIDLAKMADERFANVMGKKTAVPFDPEAHSETRRFLQSWTKETQGGYKYDQLPLFMQDEWWRTVFKFQNWGQQMQRHFHKNIFGEAKNGNVKPLLKWLAAAQLSGEAIGQTQRIFGKDRTDAEYKEIAKVFETDTGKGMLMVLNRLANNAALGGQWDLFGGMIGGNAMRYSQTGSLDAISIPAAQVVDNVKNAIAAYHETGLSDRTATEAARILSVAGKGTQLYRELTGYQPQRYDSAKRKLTRFVRQRFLKESEYALKNRRDIEESRLKGSFSPTLAATQKSGIIKAVQSGDVKKVKKLVDEFVETELAKSDVTGLGKKYPLKQDEKLIRDGIAYTVRRAQPLRALNSTSEEAVDALKQFMDENNYEGKEEILELQKQYIDTATKAGFIEPKKKKTRAQIAQEESRKGVYGLDKAAALAQRYVAENKDLLDRVVRDDQGNNVSEAVVRAAKEFSVRPSDKVTPRENAQREVFYREVVKEVKRIASMKDKDERLKEYMLPKDIGRIQNSWAKAEFLDKHFDRMNIQPMLRRGMVEMYLHNKLISNPDFRAYFDYIKTN